MLKLICQECMGTERTASFGDMRQEGTPCPWNDVGDSIVYDDNLWKEGMVHCPHRRSWATFESAMRGCLRRGMQEAADKGAMVSFEEEPC